ncbi:DUF6090 family protein [Ulvibacter sp. MAR_2010_11]|uniref:DUF6090 family protein n=1 Tax=Ulvibacter sp. MAR_2010_11 TaxID=1250229 RepID=UPI0018E251EE|nr:DUF6090 family protein [Ulvibacter sp. MAR_2010_11]
MENKTGKYFKYALGEIILVVIGILFALQINNWNQQRVQNKEEHRALINLKLDFDYNYITLDSIITRTEKSIALQTTILNHTGNKPRPKTEIEFDRAINALAALSVYFPKNGYLNDLLNSGKLDILKNTNLRNRLSSWNSVLINIKDKERNVEDQIDKFYDIMHKRGSWLNLDEVATISVLTNDPLPRSGFDIDNRHLLDLIEFENTTENIIFQNRSVLIRQKLGLDLIREIKELLEKEIKE